MPMRPSFFFFLALCSLAIPMGAQAQQRNQQLNVQAEQDAFAIAEQLYSQGMMAGMGGDEKRRTLIAAANQFNNFIARFPRSETRYKARYMQAVCLMEAQERKAANESLSILANSGKGEYAAAAAYNLANQESNQELWDKASAHYQIVLRETKRLELASDARFRLARVLQQQGKKREAEDNFRQLLVVPNLKQELLAPTLFSLAQIRAESGGAGEEEAYSYYVRLINMNAPDEKLRGMATLQAARLASKLGKQNDAQVYYARLSNMRGMENYAAEAQLENIINLYKAEDYAGIINQIAHKYVPIENAEKEAQRALIVGQAHVFLKRYDVAAQWFELAESAFPNSMIAADASYRRIVCAAQERVGNFFVLAQNHLKNYTHGDTAKSPVNDLVRLMYAEKMVHVEPADAARQYTAVNWDNIPAASRADSEFRMIWSLSQVEAPEFASAVDSFIGNYPTHAKLPNALALRGLNNLKHQRPEVALGDFGRVLEEFPKSDVAALSCQRAAQASSALNRVDKMLQYNKLLIKNYPQIKPAALAEAHFNMARALYEQQQPKQAIEHSEEAARIHPERYAPLVDMALVQCYYKMQDVNLLVESLKRLEQKNLASYKGLPPAILRWCGWRCFQKNDYENAEKYLTASVQREEKESYIDADGSRKERPKVEPLVWKTLAKSRLELGYYKRGLEAARHYVSLEKQPYRKAEGLRDEALLLIAQKQAAEGRRVAEEALNIGIDGPLKSSLYITLGDAYYALKDYSEAAKYYGRTANIVSDRELKPHALYKIAYAIRHCNKEEEAKQYEEMLKKDYPDWQPTRAMRMLMEERL